MKILILIVFFFGSMQSNFAQQELDSITSNQQIIIADTILSSDGKFLSYGFTLNGKEIGVWTHRNLETKQKWIFIYSGINDLNIFEYDSLGNLISFRSSVYNPEDSVRTRASIGPQIKFDQGIPISICNYSDEGVYQGYSIEYYANGQLKEIISFKNGNPNGSYKKFSSVGVLIQEGCYLNGAPYGLWIFYFDNGKIKEKGNYKIEFTTWKDESIPNRSVKDGEWNYWDENGKLIRIEFYEDGNLIKTKLK